MAPFSTQPLFSRQDKSVQDPESELDKWMIATAILAILVALGACLVLWVHWQTGWYEKIYRQELEQYKARCVSTDARLNQYSKCASDEAMLRKHHQVRAKTLEQEVTRLNEIIGRWERSYHQLFGASPTEPDTQESQPSQQCDLFQRPSNRRRHSCSSIASRMSSGGEILAGTEFESPSDRYYGSHDWSSVAPLTLTDFANGAAAEHTVNGQYHQPQRIHFEETQPTPPRSAPKSSDKGISPPISPGAASLDPHWAPASHN
ncbi:hypothetical protein F66182_7622 [Fusarium sp. NRRL 66182]|nr:hypothetical protein F66182_7622 [Fusarium sp. NRRL 66182]